MASAFATNPTVRGDASSALQLVPKQQMDAGLATKAPTAGPTFTGRVAKTPVVVTYSATLTIDASSGSDFDITATGALTLNALSNPINGDMKMITILGSGATRVVTLDAAIKLDTGMSATLSIPSTKLGRIGLRYSTLDSAWSCIAQNVQA